VGRFVELAVRALFFLLLSRIVSVNAASSPLGQIMTGNDLAIFFLGALLLFTFNTTALTSPVDSVMRDLHNGTLEYLYSNPSSRYAYFVGTVAANGIVSMTVFAPLYLALVVMARPGLGDTGMMLLTCLVVLASVVGIGVLIAMLGILWRQVGSLVRVLNILFELLAGAYLPLAAFPPTLRRLAYALPYTWGYDLIRYYSFRGRWSTLLPVWIEWLVLVAFAAVLLGLSRFLLVQVERRTKRSGMHLL